MKTIRDLQAHLKASGRYTGMVDGLWGPLTDGAARRMLEDGADTKLTQADFVASAQRLSVSVAQIRAVTEVESRGAGFSEGRVLILTEPHRFSKATGRRFDQSNPKASYRNWRERPYPPTQDGCYDLLMEMVRLDVAAGFASASYGRFQILGENYRACGYDSSALFAEAMARDEATQLMAFERFLASTGLLAKLRACTTDPVTCQPFCRGYNGPSFASNKYDVKLAAAIKSNQARELLS